MLLRQRRADTIRIRPLFGIFIGQGQPMRRELDIFFAALTFLTRIPAPAWVGFEPSYLNAAARYLPWVGLLLGLLHAALYLLLLQVWPPVLAVLVSTAVLVWLTGAFHEDGFADFCDGFGGGWHRSQVLAIMKDSRIGTYGSVGLMLLIAAKLIALSLLPAALAVPALIVGHCWSRWLSTSYLVDMAYVREDADSKSKPLATRLSWRGLLMASLPALALLPLLSMPQWLILIPALLLLRWRLKHYLLRRIGGFTGDCLGAAQQLAEVAIYLALVATL